MNQLQRIILINSANVDFQELKLDGNIHFIGTQGTGKSTLLRAILFFYNADSRKLGIASEKQAFKDYYFQHADSYIVYEVKQGERRFCVWLYKKQGRLCFRFIDGAYDQGLFVEHRQALLESEIIAKAAAKGYKVHRPLFNFTEYRDIIYGANRSMRRFSIIRNQSYHNIPRTISNIFLNSSLDGGFIKKTIINSLSDEVFEINLDKNRRHLETARLDYLDVSEYLKHEQQAKNIVTSYDVLLRQEEEQKELAWTIGAAYNKAKQEQLTKLDDSEKAQRAVDEQEAKIKKIKTEFANKIRLTQDKLSNIKRDISKANELAKHYATKGIETVVAEHLKKEQYKTERSQISTQLEMLKAGSKELESQYQNNKQKLETECAQQILDIKNNQQNELNEIAATLADLQDVFYQNKEKLSTAYQQKIEEQTQELQGKEKALTAIDFKIKAISEKHFFSDEVEALKNQLHSLKLEEQDFKNKSSEALFQAKQVTKEGEQQFKLLDLKYKQEEEKLNHKLEKAKTAIDTLQADIDALSGSLLEFLEQNKSDWKDTIAKVASKELLLRNDLHPQLAVGDCMYGLSVNLEDVAPIELSKKVLEQTLAAKQAEQKVLVKEMRLLRDAKQAEQDKLQKKYNKRIDALKTEAKRAASQAEQKGVAIEKNGLEQKRIEDKNTEAKHDAIAQQEEAKQSLKKALAEMTSYVQSLKNEREKLIADVSKQFNSRKKELNKQKAGVEAKITEQIELTQKDYAVKLEELLVQRNALLTEKGADIKHINSLEANEKALDDSLKLIARNWELVIRYKKDCEDYIHQLPDFKLTRKTLEKDIEHKQYLHQKRLESEDTHLQLGKEKVEHLKMILNDLAHQVKRYKHFASSALYETYQAFIAHHDSQDNWSCEVLIDKINNIAFEYEKNEKSLTERITEFSGYFSQQNYLGFETTLNTQMQYRAFAENLKGFVHTQRIIDFKTEVTKKYAMVLENIVAETRDLLEHEKEVLNIIKRINSDFKNSNFVGVVKSIEMRVQESSNKIIQLLRKIQLFEAENAMSFGEINLFNQVNSAKTDNGAVKLLESLLTQIGQAKKSKLTLEDAFDLEFRICENENDTSWVSRLANVGSNGTDVLVKSMIYINLLHIFKNNGKKNDSDTTLHCLIDEVGILHDSNVTGLIDFAGERNIRLINGSPNSHNEQDYKHIYMFRKHKDNNKTGITKLISNEL